MAHINVGREVCERGHLVSGKNVRWKKNGTGVCVACLYQGRRELWALKRRTRERMAAAERAEERRRLAQRSEEDKRIDREAAVAAREALPPPDRSAEIRRAAAVVAAREFVRRINAEAAERRREERKAAGAAGPRFYASFVTAADAERFARVEKRQAERARRPEQWNT